MAIIALTTCNNIYAANLVKDKLIAENINCYLLNEASINTLETGIQVMIDENNYSHAISIVNEINGVDLQINNNIFHITTSYNKTEKLIFYIYNIISSIAGLVISIMNFQFYISLRNDPDPNPNGALYGLIIFPILIALLISIIVTVYQFITNKRRFWFSLIPLILWILSLILLVI